MPDVILVDAETLTVLVLQFAPRAHRTSDVSAVDELAGRGGGYPLVDYGGPESRRLEFSLQMLQEHAGDDLEDRREQLRSLWRDRRGVKPTVLLSGLGEATYQGTIESLKWEAGPLDPNGHVREYQVEVTFLVDPEPASSLDPALVGTV